MNTPNSTKIYDGKLARLLFEAELEPIPVAPSQKRPSIKKWPTADCAELVENWDRYYRGHGIGLRCGRVSALDIDVIDSDIVQYLRSCLDFQHLTRIGQPPKVLVLFLCPEITKKLLSDAYVDEHGVMHRIEILSYGQFYVAYGIHPDTKKPYEWSGDLLTHSLPEVSKEFILHLFDIFYELACKKGWKNISTREKQAEKRVSMRLPTNRGNAPGSIYNRAVPLATVLEHYGWTHYKGRYWTRPDKKAGVSASVFDDRILWVFTSSTCLAPDRPYDAFEILTQYEFNGNKSECARALRRAA